MKQITKLTLVLGGLLALLLAAVVPLQQVSAQAVQGPVYDEPGCYLVPYIQPASVTKIPCDRYKVLYSNFNPDPAKCYFGWDTGTIASMPVSISCKGGPISTTPLVRPVGDIPGGDPAPSVPAPPPPPVNDGKYAPGCYLHLSPGFSKIDCDRYKIQYPSFNPDPAKCYFGWDTGFGASMPVQIDCNAGPKATSPIIKPAGDKPGNPANGEVVVEERIQADEATFNSDQCNGEVVEANDNCILDNINTVINVLSAGVGIIVVITIITAGIQYIIAGGDPQKISQAKNRIRNAIFALLAFAFLFSFLQWIVPGGIIP